MNRLLSILLLAATTLAANSAWAIALLPESDLTYINATKGYSLQYPSNWTAKENVPGFDVFLVGPPEQEGKSLANMSVISGELPKDVDLKTYAKENLKTLLAGNSTIKVVDEGNTEISGLPAQWVQYTRGDDQTEIIQFFVVKSGIGYLITGGATQAAFEDNLDLFEEIADSFSLDAQK